MYGWAEIYQRGMPETDRSKLRGRIEAAQTAINRRIQEINAGHDSVDERRAIRDALASLDVLRREVLSLASD